MSEVILDNQLSFFGKVKKFNKLFNSSLLTHQLLTINTIRNELAHNINFDIYDSGIFEWADEVLAFIQYDVNFRRTERTKVIHAFAALAGEIYKYNRLAFSKRAHHSA